MISSFSSSGYEGKRRIVESLRPGTQTTCYVNPDDPTDAVLRRNSLWHAFIILMPIFLTNAPHMIGLDLDVALQKHIELMVFGGLIIFFLIVEPHGLARLWQISKEKLRLWPFPH